MALLGGALALAYDTLGDVRHVREEFAAVQVTLQASDIQRFTDAEEYAALAQQVRSLEARVRQVKRRLGPLGALGWVPFLGPRVREARQLLAVGEPFAEAARLTLDGFAGVPSALLKAEPEAAFEALRNAVVLGGPLFQRAERSLAQAKAARGRLRAPYVLSSVTEPVVTRVDQYTPLVELALMVARQAPELPAHAYTLQLGLEEVQRRAADAPGVLRRPQGLRDLLERAEVHRNALEAGLLYLEPDVAVLDSEGNTGGQLLRFFQAQIQGVVLVGHLQDVALALLDMSEESLERGLFTSEFGAFFQDRLSGTEQALTSAQAQLEHVRNLVEAEEEAPLSLVLQRIQGITRGQLDRVDTSLSTSRETLQFLRYFLGFDGPRTFLMVAENDDEIRATGGFIGLAVEFSLENGELTHIRYLDSVDVDGPTYENNPPAPEPVYRYLWMERLLFRDANWNPHFPASAVSLADIYQRSQGVRVDGVIAGTEEMALDLVQALGKVRVAELPEALDRDTAERYVEGNLPYTCRPRHASPRPKRCFDEDLIRSLLDRLMGPLSSAERAQVAETLVSALFRKDLLVHVFDADASPLLWQQQWNGAVRQVDHDYLLLVDSSIPGHAFRIIDRSIEYRVSLVPQQAVQAQVRLRYVHNGSQKDPECRQSETLKFGCYWNYFRLFIPIASRDIVAPPVPLHPGSEWLIWGYPTADSQRVISTPRPGLAALTEIGGYVRRWSLGCC